jgi:hypothetical protein
VPASTFIVRSPIFAGGRKHGGFLSLIKTGGMNFLQKSSFHRYKQGFGKQPAKHKNKGNFEK